MSHVLSSETVLKSGQQHRSCLCPPPRKSERDSFPSAILLALTAPTASPSTTLLLLDPLSLGISLARGLLRDMCVPSSVEWIFHFGLRDYSKPALRGTSLVRRDLNLLF